MLTMKKFLYLLAATKSLAFVTRVSFRHAGRGHRPEAAWGRRPAADGWLFRRWPGRCRGKSRVFTYEMGDTPGDPTFTEDPGFHSNITGLNHDAIPLGNLPVNANLSFKILSPLTYWDGAGSPVFVPAAGGQLKWFLGPPAKRFCDRYQPAQPGTDPGEPPMTAARSHVHIGSRFSTDPRVGLRHPALATSSTASIAP